MCVRQYLSQLEAQGLSRRLFLPQGVDVSSNDILGLSRHPQIRRDMVESLRKGLPLGSGGSRLLRGHHKQHEEVERFLADKFKCEAALVYGSGYLANMGVITSLFKDFHIFSDELNHASLIDGMRLSGAEKSIYKHCDVEDLERKMSRSNATNKVIISESLFSMDGDFIPLPQICELAQQHGAWLFIDEAHGTGIYGQRGLGLVDELKSRKNIISVHTMGKAFGSQGAFVLCSQEIKDGLVNTSRSFIYTTSLSPLIMEQWMSAWRVWESEPQIRQGLLDRISWFQQNPRPFMKIPNSHIVPVVIPGNRRVMEMAAVLQSKNFDVRAIRYPTVPKGGERLRICLNVTQTYEQLEEIFCTIERLL